MAEGMPSYKFIDLSDETEKRQLQELLRLQDKNAPGVGFLPSYCKYYSYLHRDNMILARCIIDSKSEEEVPIMFGLDHWQGEEPSVSDILDKMRGKDISYISDVDVRSGDEFRRKGLCSNLLKQTVTSLLGTGKGVIMIYNGGKPATAACKCYIGSAIDQQNLRVYIWIAQAGTEGARWSGVPPGEFSLINYTGDSQNDKVERDRICNEYCTEETCRTKLYILINESPPNESPPNAGGGKYKKRKFSKRTKKRTKKRPKKRKKRRTKRKTSY